jgi:hypothetical protein
MNEHDALTVLDRRMTAASAELRRAVDDALGDRPAAGASAASRESGGAGVGLSPAIKLERSAAPSRRQRRWVWAAAAGVIAVAGVAGLVIVGGGKDEDAPPASTGAQPFLVPGWLPAGWGPQSAVRGGASADPPSTATVYGSSTAADPWTGDAAVVVRVDAGGSTAPAGAETVDVSGHTATLARDGETLTVTVPLGDRTYSVTGRGVDRDALLRVAAAAVDGQPIEAVLPPGLVEVARGSLDVAGLPPPGGLSLVYGTDSSAHSVTITQRPGQASEVGLLRLVLPAPNTMTEVEVRGQPGVLLESPAGSDAQGAGIPSIVQWVEAPGLLVTVFTEGLEGEDLMRLAEEMRPSTDAEIGDLVDRYYAPPVVSDDLQEGEVVVAAGDRGADHWQVTAREDAGSIDVSYADESAGFGFAVAPGPGSAPALDVTTSDTVDERGERAMIGVVDPTVTRVVVEAAGQPPLPVDVYRHDGLTGAVIVGFVPRAYDDGEVVALDADGLELARTPLEQ